MLRRISHLVALAVLPLALLYLLLQIGQAAADTTTVDTASDAGMPTWGNGQIGYIIDTTSGQQPVINTLITAWNLEGGPWDASVPTPTYHLVAYRDEVSYLGGTTNLDQFKASLSNLNADGGGNCRDAALQGVREMLRNTPDGFTPPSELFLVSGSQPNGERMNYARIAEQVNRRGAHLNVMTTGWCNDAPFDETPLGFMALSSGGKYYFSDAANIVTDTVIAYNRLNLDDTILNVLGEVTPGNPETFIIPVDGPMTTLGVEDDYYNCLTCINRIALGDFPTYNPAAVNVEIRDPNGNLISGNPNYTLIQSDYRTLQRIEAPAGQTLPTGNWTITVSGNEQFSLSVRGDSAVHLSYTGRTNVASGETLNVRAALLPDSGSGVTVTSVDFKLVSMDGAQEQPINLFDDGIHGDGQAGDGIYGGQVVPQGINCWFLTAEGTLSDGSTFRRQYTTPIRILNFRMQQPNSQNLMPGMTRSVTFELINETAVTEAGGNTVFDLELFSSQGWAVTSTVPSSITLAPGESYVVEVDVTIPATATLGTFEETMLFAAPVGDLGQMTSAVAETSIVDELLLYLPSAVNRP